MGASMPGAKLAAPRWLQALPFTYLLAGLAWISGSDLVVSWLFRSDFDGLVYASTLKGALFVIVTAMLLYVLLTLRRADFIAEARRPDPFALRKPLIAFLLVGLGIASIGYVVYRLEADGIRVRAGKQLETFTAIAAQHLAMWHQGHIRSMRDLAGSATTARAILEFQTNRSDTLESMLRDRLQAIRRSQDYASVTAVDKHGRILIEVGNPVQVSTDLRQSVTEAIATGRVISHWSTINQVDGGRQPVVYVLIALHDQAAQGTPAVAVVIARAHVHWPLGTAASSVDQLDSTITLARVEGTLVGLMVPSPHGQPHRYQLLPRVHAELFTTRAFAGEKSAYLAQDAGRRRVLAAGQPVEATPWFTVATAELHTIEEQIRRLMLLIAGMSAIGCIAMAGIVLPWWSSIRAGTTRLIQQADSRADEMATRLGWVTRYAHDVILLIGQDGRILDANDRAEQVYGYTRDELLALDVFRLRPADPVQQAAATEQFETVNRAGTLVFEAFHSRRDGSTFPVEVSSRRVMLNGQAYIQCIVRDISERRRFEEKLRESEAQYRLMFRSNPHPMWVYDVETLAFLAVNDAAITHYGYAESEFLRFNIADIRPAADRERLRQHVAAHAHDVLRRSGGWRHRRKDGSLIDVEITSHQIDFDGRRARLVLATDITDQLRAELALRTNEERYRQLFENASDGVLLVDPSRRVVGANAEYQAMLGYSLQELLCIDVTLLLDEQEHARFGTALAVSDRLPDTATWLHRRKDGSRFIGEVRLRALPNGEVLATVRDLTEIIAARRRIERQRDLYELLSQCNQVMVRAGDRHDLLHSVARLAVERGRFRFAWIGEINEAGEIVATASAGDDRGYFASLRSRADAASPEGIGPARRALREGKTAVANDFLNDPSTASWHEAARRSGIAASAAFPIFMGGKVTAALMLYAGEVGYFDAELCATLGEIAADVSYAIDSLRTRRELEDNRLLLQSLIDTSDALVFAFDLEGRAILMNEACAHAMGGTRASLMGQRRELSMPKEAAFAHDLNDRRVIETGEHLMVEERNQEAGVERVYLSVKYPLRDVDGRVYAVGGISTDITELRRMQHELEGANRLLEERVADRTREAMEACARAEAADRAKTAFLGTMSHELRSPLNSIIGFTSVLLEGMDGELSPVQQDHLRIVSDASRHLLAIINDLLDMSKIEAGAVAPEVKQFPINPLLQRVVHRFALLARQKDLLLQLEDPAEVIQLVSDERRVEQILSNLVSNAIKYTSAGVVTVSCSTSGNLLQIDVRDTGPGIAAEDRGYLFKRFSQLKPARGGLVEGAGLGLAIAAGLAEALGGDIRLQSELGVGSVFSLVLPTNAREAPR